MSTLKERLAAIAAAKAASAVPAEEKKAELDSTKQQNVSPLALDIPETPPAPQPSAAPERPLTFAEKLALKRGEIKQAQAAPQKEEKKPLEIDPATIPENPEDAQAYVDIKHRIHDLEDKFDDELESAMDELKAALKKNPNAVSLMLHTDIGKMVSALRRMAGIQLEQKTTAKKPGRKKTEIKAVDITKLTPDQIAEAIDF